MKMGRGKDRSRTLRLLVLLGLLAMLPAGAVVGEETAEDLQLRRIRGIVLSRGDSTAALSNLVQLSKDLDEAAGARLYLDLADNYLQVGQYDLAGRVLQQLLSQYENQPQAIEALITSARLYSSSEVIRCMQESPKLSDLLTSATYALHISEKAIQKRPEWSENAALSFQSAVAARLSGKSALGWLTPLKHNARTQPWNHRAQTESWLREQRKQDSPKQTLTCRTASDRPHLDGVLDELRWQSAGYAVIAPAEKNREAGFVKIQLSRDDDFLYLAVRCAKSSRSDYLADHLPRAHDADLSKHDHVVVELDADRDYATAYKLSVDHRGQTADQCWKDRSWNPQWFVAVSQEDSYWTLEAAIAWDELTAQAPQIGEAWALSLKRVLPGEEPQSWAGGTESVGDAFGLVLFE